MSDRKNVDLIVRRATRRQIIAGAAVALGGIAVGSINALAGGEDGISHTAESIHQEPVFKASRKRVYEALMDAKQFGRVERLGVAMQGMSAGAKPTQISAEAGAAFSLFGGYVTGRNVELVANERIVQAWRAGGWDPGSYSIVRFELTEQGSSTKIVFDHTGFPEGKAQHLADGWKGNYWEPLEKYLAQAQGS